MLHADGDVGQCGDETERANMSTTIDLICFIYIIMHAHSGGVREGPRRVYFWLGSIAPIGWGGVVGGAVNAH